MEDLAVVQSQWRQSARQGEDHMEVSEGRSSERRTATHRSRALI
jgi:hypothetical protein